MGNKEIVIAGLSEWLSRVGASVLPKVSIPQTSGIGQVMGSLFGFNMAQYNVWNELGFLLQPTIKNFVAPTVGKYLSAIPDEQIQPMVMEYADAFIKQANEKGSVNLFGIELGANAFEGLKEIMTNKFNGM